MAMMFQTLARTMAPNAKLLAECEVCGRDAAWTRPMAFKTFGPDATPPDIRRRLRCLDCGGQARIYLTATG
jgi:hypothetical protein